MVHGVTDPNILLWANSLDTDPIHVFSAGQEATNEMKWLSRPNGTYMCIHSTVCTYVYMRSTNTKYAYYHMLTIFTEHLLMNTYVFIHADKHAD